MFIEKALITNKYNNYYVFLSLSLLSLTFMCCYYRLCIDVMQEYFIWIATSPAYQFSSVLIHLISQE